MIKKLNIKHQNSIKWTHLFDPNLSLYNQSQILGQTNQKSTNFSDSEILEYSSKPQIINNSINSLKKDQLKQATQDSLIYFGPQPKPISFAPKQASQRGLISEQPHDWPGRSTNNLNRPQTFEQILTQQLPSYLFYGRNQVVNYDYIHRSDSYTYFYPIVKCHMQTHKELSEKDIKMSDDRGKKYKMTSDVAIPLIKIRNIEIQKELQQRQRKNPFWRLK